MFLYATLQDFDSSLSASLFALQLLGPASFADRYAPRPSLAGFIGFTAWVLLQASLYTFLPTKISSGQLTPAGHLLQYKTNGLFAWFVTVALTLILAATGFFDPPIVAIHWEGLLIAANVYGFILSVLVYLKAYAAPTHPNDRKFSG
jgi:7-dehydrocholesterol reductase